MKYLFLITLLASSVGFAHENNCTIGYSQYGSQTVIVNDTAVDFHKSLEDAVEAFVMLTEAGVCSDVQSNCTIGLSKYGSQTVVVNGTAVDFHKSLEDAVTALSSLKANGVCE